MFTANDFSFRTKFTKTVKFLSAEEAAGFKEWFINILNHSEEFIIGLLWSLSYDPTGEVSPKKYLSDLLQLRRFSKKQRLVIQNEIRYQFNKAHPNFLDVPEKGWPEYQALVNASSELTSYVVLQRCRNLKTCSPEFVQQELYHLTLNFESGVDSNVEAKVLKAIKYLNFNLKAAEFLLPHAKEIAALLKAVTSKETVVRMAPPKYEVQAKIPAEEAQPQEATDNVPLPEPQAEQAATDHDLVQNGPAETPITSELVIRYSSELETFFQLLDILKSRKVDTFYLVRALPEIKQFLLAVEGLEEVNLSVEEIFEKSSKIRELLNAWKKLK